MKTLIKNAFVVNEGRIEKQNLVLRDEYIEDILSTESTDVQYDNIIDAEGLYLLPGVIDDQVHFREPGATHKADIHSESRAAVAGGVTSYMEMPNTNPSTTNAELLRQKFDIAAENSMANYSFFIGATEENSDDIAKIDTTEVAGVKLFLGSSTGSLLVKDKNAIEEIMRKSPTIIAAHCEDDGIISQNLQQMREIYGDDIPMEKHCEIRNAEACYKSSNEAAEIAKRTGAHLHIFHISTEKELSLLSNKSLEDKKLTAEVCVHHLFFNSDDYKKLGARIKWNPAVKYESDRQALIKALKEGKIDVVATDHAPHTWEEKCAPYTKCPSGAPMVQHSLQVMIELAKQGNFGIEDVVKWMCHNPAKLYKIDRRGYIRKGYFADLVLVDMNAKYEVSKDNILYKCKWSPLEGYTLNSKIVSTFVNGKLAFNNGKIIEGNKTARKLKFNR
ncbi:MAG: dihydroorotase [Bacteroidales bacterium]|nr:dihydroorotase [Bacteroidales bacterium]